MEEGSIFTVMGFPSPWPPATQISILETKVNGAKIVLVADSAGRLELAITTPALTHRFLSQRLEVLGAGQTSIIVSWHQSGCEIWLGETELLPDGPSTPSRTVGSSRQEPRSGHGRIFLTLDPMESNDLRERLFLHTLNDIDERVLQGTDHDLIRAAAHLRQLLMDGNKTLLSIVNRQYRLHIEFSVLNNHEPLPPIPGVIHHWRDLDPTCFEKATRIRVRLDELLKVPCLMTPLATATVSDIIRTCANVMGGVHLGVAKSKEDQVVVDFADMMQIYGSAGISAALSGLCRVVLSGLTPLVIAIREAHYKSQLGKS